MVCPGLKRPEELRPEGLRLEELRRFEPVPEKPNSKESSLMFEEVGHKTRSVDGPNMALVL